MSIQRRLGISITFVLLFSLAVGFGLTYRHVLSKVRTEMQAALNVGADTALNAIGDSDHIGDPLTRLRRIVADFNGDRHLKAVLTSPDGHLILQSHLLVPEDPAPSWFYRITVSMPAARSLVLPKPFADVGTLVLAPDPHNEVAEAWGDLRLTLIIMAVFFAMVLALAFITIKAALAPLRDVCDALRRIGAGDNSVRIAPEMFSELEPLRDGFNGMALQLDEMSRHNHALQEQILNLQEEERAELARDLHDDVAPFLFAVGADAAMIRQYLVKGAIDEVGPRAEAIAEAVRHMQRHLKDVLRRLAPGALLDLGLPGAIDNLVGFWRMRRPNVVFSVAVSGEPIDPPLDAVAFRVVQESFSNAIRHGDPTAIDVVIDVDDDRATIVVEDDGGGFPNGIVTFGFGLTGMQDRVRAAGGTLSVRNCQSRGVFVEAILPLTAKGASSEARSPEDLQAMDLIV